MTKPTTPLPKSLTDAHPAGVAMYQALGAVSKATKGFEFEFSRAVDAGAIDAARAFVVLRRLKDVFEQVEKEFEALYGRAKSEDMPKALEKAGITNVPLAEGWRVTCSSVLYASIRSGMKDEAFKWLRKPPKHFPQLGDLITETVNASTLSAAARSLLEEQNLELPSELFNVAPVLNTSVTATKKGT